MAQTREGRAHRGAHMSTTRIRLTTREIDALLIVAGAADAPAVAEDHGAEEGDRLLTAFESGMDKLRQMLAARKDQ